MRRGTTPVLTINVNGIDVSEFSSIYITFEQGAKEITKEIDDVTLDTENNRIIVSLSQSETLSFKDGELKVQLRAITNQGKAVASTIKKLDVGHILKEGVIT